MSQKSPESSLEDKDTNDSVMNGTEKDSQNFDESIDVDMDEIPTSAKDTSTEKSKTKTDSDTMSKENKVRRSSRSRSRCSSSELKSDKIEEPTSTLDEAKIEESKKDNSKKDVSKKDISKKDISKKDDSKKDDSKIEESKKDISKKDVSKKDISKKDISKKDDSKIDESKKDNSKKEISKKDISKKDDSKIDESKKDPSKKDISKIDESKKDNSKKDESQKDESKKDNSKKDDLKKDDSKKDNIKSDDLKKDESKKENTKKDDLKKDLSKKDNSKKDDSKKDNSKKDDSKKDNEKTDGIKNDETNKIDTEDEEEVVEVSDDSDFFGFDSNEPLLAVIHAKFLKKKRTNSEDDVASQEASSEHMSIDNPPSVESDSNTLSVTSTGGRRSLRSSKKSIQADITNSEFKKPFDHGWTRELVYRSSQEVSNVPGRRNADVYYYTPSNKKIRSSRELAEHLTDGLTTENFSFFKESLGINDPTKEIIREAKVKGGAPKITEEVNVKKPPIKGKPIKIKPQPEVTSKMGMPRVYLSKTNTVNKRSITNKTKLDKKRKSTGPDDADMDVRRMSDNDWSPEQKHPTRDVCSIDCRLAMGLIPSLQCNSCLCLYHPECVGFPTDKLRQSNPYTCRNCQVVIPPSTALLPPPPPSSTKPPLTPVKKDLKVISVTRSQPIVGALTTWLPPSSSIQVSQNSLSPKTSTVSISGTTSTTNAGSLNPTPAEAFNPQSIVTIEGTQFVMIHKRNIVNVSDQNNHSPNPGSTTESVANLISTAPGTYVASSQPQIGKPPLILVPYQIPDHDSQLQIPVVNSSIQGIVPVQPGGSFQNGVKRISLGDGSSPPPEKRLRRDFPVDNPLVYLRENFMMNLNAGFTALLHAFQYLKVHELLRAVCVSQMWRHIATHKSLWETVRMKNSRVRDWEGFGKALLHQGTKSIDLRKMLLPDVPEQMNSMWLDLSNAVSGLPELKKIDFGRCTSQAIETVAKACPQLESIISLSIRGNELDLCTIANCENLVELRLKNVVGMDIKNLSALKKLKNLKVLALTTVKNIDGITGLSETIENLELGDSIKLSETFASETLPTLVKLKRLRLEKGQGNCPTIALLNSISNLPNLTQLELINFDIKPGFEKALAKCSNIKTLLIIPTYITQVGLFPTQSATTNHVVMGGVSKLNQTLTYFIWGLTLELLRVTDLFIDQVEGHKGKSQTSGGKKPGAGDSIPILKPIGEGGELKEGPGASQVDILGLPKLQKVLSTLLPTTKIKILKVPFSATWRQTVTDGPNQ